MNRSEDVRGLDVGVNWAVAHWANGFDGQQDAGCGVAGEGECVARGPLGGGLVQRLSGDEQLEEQGAARAWMTRAGSARGDG